MLELDTDALLPGRLVDGRLHVTAKEPGEFRAARVSLVGTETWRFDETTTDAHGNTRTETQTAEEELPKVPVAVLGTTTEI